MFVSKELTKSCLGVPALVFFGTYGDLRTYGFFQACMLNRS